MGDFEKSLDRWLTREQPEPKKKLTKKEQEAQDKIDEQRHKDAHNAGWCVCNHKFKE